MPFKSQNAASHISNDNFSSLLIQERKVLNSLFFVLKFWIDTDMDKGIFLFVCLFYSRARLQRLNS